MKNKALKGDGEYRRWEYWNTSENISEEKYLTSVKCRSTCADIWGTSIPEGGKSMCKGREMETCLTHLRISL